MTRRKTSKKVLALAGMACAAMVAMALPVSSTVTQAAAAEGSSEGMVCTTNHSTGASDFLLTAKDGYISMPDGNSVYMWGYAAGNGGFQHPGPILCVTEGDKVTVTLHNTLAVLTSIQFPGQTGVTANGDPAQAQFDASGNLTSLTNAAQPTQSVTYQFTASKPGSFIYESGTDEALQVQMGLFGTIVVKPDATTLVGVPAGAAYGYDTVAGITHTAVSNTVYNAANENMLMLSEVDPDLHLAAEQAKGASFNSSDYTKPYHARYFLINGRSFPDTVAPNGAAWLPTQPYGALARVKPYDAAINPLPAMLHYAGFGISTYPFHPHSNHEKVIGIDGRPLMDGATDLSSEKFAVVVNPGQTQDATFVWTNIEDYNSATNAVPVTPPRELNIKQGDLFSGTPYLGEQGIINQGINTKDECGEYYHVAHSHDLTQSTNYGISFGGMLTLIRVDPASGKSVTGVNCG